MNDGEEVNGRGRKDVSDKRRMIVLGLDA